MGKPWVGVSQAHHRIVETLRRLAPTDLEILLTGPSGVGKERYARFAHEHSGRRGELVAFNCGAVPPELFENELFGHVGGAFTGARAESCGLVAEAEAGTLFLDEIDTLSPRNQIALLRFLQEKEYRRLGDARTRRADVRVIAATNADLLAACRDGRFREDLLFRIRVAPVEVPALRDRPDDIDAIVAEYAAFYGAHYGLPAVAFDPAARAALRAHAWPGNVREVENCVRFLTCLQLGRDVTPADLPFGARGPASDGTNGTASNGTNGTNGHGLARGTGAMSQVDFRAAKAAMVDDLERSLVTAALEQANGNITHAARTIGKPRRTFFELMRKHKITVRER